MAAHSLAGCFEVGDFAVLAVAEGCARLEGLALDRTAVTAVGLSVVATAATALRWLSVADCAGLDAEFPGELGQLPRLQALDVSGSRAAVHPPRAPRSACRLTPRARRRRR